MQNCDLKVVKNIGFTNIRASNKGFALKIELPVRIRRLFSVRHGYTETINNVLSIS